MLEILGLVAFGNAIAKQARLRGRRPQPYVIALVVLWFGGEFIAGFSVGALGLGNQLLFLYLFGLAGALAGGFIAYSIVNSLPPFDKDPPLEDAADDDLPHLELAMTELHPDSRTALPTAQPNIVRCGSCGTRVRPTAEGNCPACRQPVGSA